ncbi:bifunctional phosphopantothenoylcysteine decarboxylase/phosphopantothenate--cysteine ligase CoaBC [Sandarakinorhabdus oryzae]|uniref:bifunctional phosphopantothenoylcysteine decarboxylase/phosphopantothenate--cysteine ligase CoaBC n=1 Tax=Sandarakinorhabdus oryzae TaxID=2675220 RepID=UPI0012E18903|nr:bifunctional phosphopantothenoylcysteine decarboxylase/phosphopantothenate--cysteine ligase CoaBC [Sandarakinorhabdus oryzae]
MRTLVHGKTILLIVGGGIAAFKALELVRELRRAGARVLPVLTENGTRFVTPLSLSALAGEKVRTSLWDLEDEAAMGHIQLSRAADLIVVCPATASLIQRAAAGAADDLATTLLLATDTPVLMVPAMNVRMWLHAATQRNVATLRGDGVTVMTPDDGEMACGEFGPGRLPDVAAIMAAIAAQFGPKPLLGRHALVTAGPTHEPIDPVRFIGNHSSGKQGFAIAGALASLGARVTLVAGPVHLPSPAGVTRVDVMTARDMQAACEAALPADIAVMVAAVADWRADAAARKLKKDGQPLPPLQLTENPDILAGIGQHTRRPALVVGFAAETHDLIANAAAKRVKKGADWIVANNVSDGVFGADSNHVHLVTATGAEDWGAQAKQAVATTLANRIAVHFSGSA